MQASKFTFNPEAEPFEPIVHNHDPSILMAFPPNERSPPPKTGAPDENGAWQTLTRAHMRVMNSDGLSSSQKRASRFLGMSGGLFNLSSIWNPKYKDEKDSWAAHGYAD
jgi:hypothetical protein